MAASGNSDNNNVQLRMPTHSRKPKSSGIITSLHVNPPSFVQSLRHFAIAENLRPGNENLRHLTVTSRLKNCTYFCQTIVKTQPNFRAFSTYCFSTGAQRSMVGEIIAPRKCQAWRQYTILANSDSCLIIGHARAGAH